MGYTAYTVDTDFTVPADKIDAALAAVDAALNKIIETRNPAFTANFTAEFTSLAEAFEENTGFDNSEEDETGFRLGNHTDKYFDEEVEGLLGALAPFAAEGSYVRFQGEDDALWGFRVIAGQLENESGNFVWKVIPRRGTGIGKPAIEADGSITGLV